MNLKVCAVSGRPAQPEARFVRIKGTDIVYRVNPDVVFTPEVRAEVEARLNPPRRKVVQNAESTDTDVHDDSN